MIDPTGSDVPGALDGIRVLDLSSVLMGPFSTQILADFGADVITIEDHRGDTNRSMGPGPVPGLSGVSMNLLRNKRSVGLDLKRDAGRAAFLRIAETVDIVITNLRPGPLGRLGLGYDDVQAVKPDIIFCQAHGYPSDGPDAESPAYDDIIQSASAVGDLFERQGYRPSLLPTLVADKVSGLTIASAVLAALFHRTVSGRGQHIEVPMIDVMRAFVLVEHGAGAIPEPPLDRAGYRRILTAERRPQATADGWINVLPYTDDHYHALFTAGDRPDLVTDPRIATRESRIANSDSLYREVGAILATRGTDEWLAFCAEHGIPSTRAASLDDLVADLPIADHPVGGRYRVVPPPVRFSATPSSVRSPAPWPESTGRSCWPRWATTRPRSIVSSPMGCCSPLSRDGISDAVSDADDPWDRVVMAAGALVVVLGSGTVSYRLLGLSWLDAFYQTLITVSTVGYGEVADEVTPAYRAVTSVLILVGVGIGVYAIGQVFGALLEGRLTDHVGRSRMRKEISRTKDHVIVCGWGQVGKAIAAEVTASGRAVVVVDRDPALHDDLAVVGVVGEATEDEVLVAAGIERAASLVVALDGESDNLFVTLSGRALNPDLFIVTRAVGPTSASKLLHAGADRVVNPHEIGAGRMSSFVLQPNVADFLGETMTDGDLRVRLWELTVDESSPVVRSGQSLDDSGLLLDSGLTLLAVRRPDGSFEHCRGRAWVPEVGDVLIVLGTVDQHQAALGWLASHP